MLQLLKPADPRAHLVQVDSSHLLKLEKAHMQWKNTAQQKKKKKRKINDHPNHDLWKSKKKKKINLYYLFEKQ